MINKITLVNDVVHYAQLILFHNGMAYLYFTPDDNDWIPVKVEDIKVIELTKA